MCTERMGSQWSKVAERPTWRDKAVHCSVFIFDVIGTLSEFWKKEETFTSEKSEVFEEAFLEGEQLDRRLSDHKNVF